MAKMKCDWENGMREWVHYFTLDNGRKPSKKEWLDRATMTVRWQLEDCGEKRFTEFTVVNSYLRKGTFAGDFA